MCFWRTSSRLFNNSGTEIRRSLDVLNEAIIRVNRSLIEIGNLVSGYRIKAISILFPNNPSVMNEKEFSSTSFSNIVAKLSTNLKEDLVYLFDMIDLNQKKEMKLLKAKDFFYQKHLDINISPNGCKKSEIETLVFQKMEEIKDERLPKKKDANFINFDDFKKCLFR